MKVKPTTLGLIILAAIIIFAAKKDAEIKEKSKVQKQQKTSAQAEV